MEVFIMSTTISGKQLIIRRSKSTLYDWLNNLEFNRAPNGKEVIPFYIEPQRLTFLFTKNKITGQYNSIEKYVGISPNICPEYGVREIVINDRPCLEVVCEVNEKSIIYKKDFNDYVGLRPAIVHVCISEQNRIKLFEEKDIEKNRIRQLQQHKQIFMDWGYTDDQADTILTIGNCRAMEAFDWINLLEYNSPNNLVKVHDIINTLLRPKRTVSSNNLNHLLRIAKIRPLPSEYKSFTDLWQFLSSAHEILQFKIEKTRAVAPTTLFWTNEL